MHSIPSGERLMPSYDIAVIGAGPGGYVAALRAAQLGASTCLIEKGTLGGTCLNIGCIPTKAILESARLAVAIRGAGRFGLVVPEPQVNYAEVAARKDRIVKKLTSGVRMLLKAAKVAVHQGCGHFLSPTEIEVVGEGESTKIQARNTVIATGSVAARPAFFGVDGKKVITSDEILALTKLPESLLVIGGGYIGCEFAGALAAFGVRVTVVEMLPRLMPLGDADISKELTKHFKKQGIKVVVDTKIEELTKSDVGVRARLSDGKTLDAELALVSVGRLPYTEGLGLDAAGLALDDRGFIDVDDQCRTSVENIYAIGDVTGRLMLAHVASHQGMVAAEAASGHPAQMRYDAVPAGVFTIPEIGIVGLTEEEARQAGHDLIVGRFPFQANGKALAMEEPEGFVKLVAEAETGVILGAHIIGPHATDLVAEVATAMTAEATVHELAEAIHAHPTTAEAVMEAALATLGRPIHIPG